MRPVYLELVRQEKLTGVYRCQILGRIVTEHLIGAVVVTNVRAYRKYLREQARLDDASASAYQQLRNRKMEAQAEVAELKLKLYKRKLHRSEDVEFVMTAIKSRLLAIPSRTSRLVLGKTNLQEVNALIYSEIELVLRELADYDPNSFEQANEEYLALVAAESGKGWITSKMSLKDLVTGKKCLAKGGALRSGNTNPLVGSVRGGPLPALSCQV